MPIFILSLLCLLKLSPLSAALAPYEQTVQEMRAIIDSDVIRKEFYPQHSLLSLEKEKLGYKLKLSNGASFFIQAKYSNELIGSQNFELEITPLEENGSEITILSVEQTAVANGQILSQIYFSSKLKTNSYRLELLEDEAFQSIKILAKEACEKSDQASMQFIYSLDLLAQEDKPLTYHF